ncbi:sensor histidine kinase [Actinomycetospora lutea]|uniref:sensor histidine kinase n=1 Tax=Actinomycetospora lutea TaxID=663604 RepID=UPI0023654451|nr:sensor histidine kinase [Actinomycetospora lutea]MDD7937375.1 sensor histidine kinase [Actinomycetospora lutea]
MQAVRPTRTDAVLAVAVSCLVAAAIVGDAGRSTDPDPAVQAVAYAFALGFGGLLLLSRSWPVPVLLATALGLVAWYVIDLPAIGLAAPAAAALYATAERGHALGAAAVAAGLLVISVVARLAEGDDVGTVLGFDAGAEAVLMVAVIALGDAVRSRRALRAELVRQAREAEEEQAREAARQVEAERVRIARELHDSLGHTMSVVSLQAALADEALTDGETAQAHAAVAAIGAAGAGAMTELRATLSTLRRDSPSSEPPAGLDRLPALVDGVSRSGVPVELRLRGDTSGLPAIIATTAYRVVQEALTNVLRHAGADRAHVTVEVGASRVVLEVADDGRGVPGRVETGDGLRGITERVALLGGDVHLGNGDEGGFVVRACLPRVGDGP